eukprot:402581-Hanusia_phi.AAC.1
MVLDLCAAPGSKTLQALDGLHRNLEPGEEPLGGIVANDIDERRAYGLAARARPVGSFAKNLMIVCHKAQKIPNVRVPGEEGIAESAGCFDRILCDVPCSGDGTLRKNTKVWKLWDPLFGIKIHRLQVQIAMRGLALLKVGGLMAYSTCSFNPIEDEAVVADLLR